MADFCLQCAHEMRFDCDFTGIMSEAEHQKGLKASVLCESCGPIQVDGHGKCITIGCLENHNPDLNIAIGTHVEKIKGYKWPGVVVSRFPTLKKLIRYTVECTAPEVEGALHIFSPIQIRKVNG